MAAANGSFSATNSTSANFAPLNGWALVTVFVNAIPSPSYVMYATAASPIKLASPLRLGGGTFQFGFTNFTGGLFTVLASTSPTLSRSAWTSIGYAMESPAGSGKYQFTDPGAPGNAHRFYQVVAP